MPRLRNDRRTTLATSASQPARMSGRASRTVTLVPRSPIIDANSQPMAPPPMTAAVAGSRLIANSSSEVTTNSPSTTKPPMVRGVEPEARMTDPPDRVCSVPSSAVARTVPDGPRAPTPEHTVTFALSEDGGQPGQHPVDHPLLAVQHRRPVEAGLARAHAELRRPRHGAVHRGRLQELLAGMQPTCRQVPPTLAFSTTATSRPALAPYRAAA